jgi:hypothetical protein
VAGPGFFGPPIGLVFWQNLDPKRRSFCREAEAIQCGTDRSGFEAGGGETMTWAFFAALGAGIAFDSRCVCRSGGEGR